MRDIIKTEVLYPLLLILAVFFVVALGLHDLRDPNHASVLYDITHRDRLDLVVMGEHYGAVSLYWREEVARRYSDAVIVLGHGGQPAPEGWWSIEDQISEEVMPMTEMIRRVRLKYPYRRIVVISCNTQHQYLPAENVTYALKNVWFYPDNIMLTPLNKITGEDECGDIFEFVEQ